MVIAGGKDEDGKKAGEGQALKNHAVVSSQGSWGNITALRFCDGKDRNSTEYEKRGSKTC